MSRHNYKIFETKKIIKNLRQNKIVDKSDNQSSKDKLEQLKQQIKHDKEELKNREPIVFNKPVQKNIVMDDFEKEYHDFIREQTLEMYKKRCEELEERLKEYEHEDYTETIDMYEEMMKDA